MNARPIAKEDYRRFFDEAVRQLESGRAKPNRKELLLGARVRFFRETGDRKYLEPVVAEVRTWIAGARTGKVLYPVEFIGRYPVALALTLAIEQGSLTPGEQQAARDIGSTLLVRGIYEGGGWMNRSVGYALGIRPLLKLAPNHVLAPELHRYADGLEWNLLRYGEQLEDSANYITIPLIYTPIWIEDNAHEALKRDSKIRNFFERALQTVSPAGGIPSYGDYGGEAHARMSTVAGFEWAARTYRDGRFKWAAHRVAAAGAMGKPASEQAIFTGYDLFGLAYAYAWADDTVAGRALQDSAVTRTSTGRPDKLVLRGGAAPTDTYVLVDLHNGSEHGDNDALAVVSIFKDGQPALTDQGGRNIANHSSPLVREKKADFPLVRPGYGLGRWRFVSLDLKSHWSFGNFPGGVGSKMPFRGVGAEETDPRSNGGANPALPPDFHYDPAKEWVFALKCTGQGAATLHLDQMKLVAKDGSEKVFEDFEQPTRGWFGRFRRVEGAREGRWCGAVDFDFAEEWPMAAKKFPLPLDIDEGRWERLEFWYKLEAASPDATVWAAMVGDQKGYPRNYLFHHNPMFPVEAVAFEDRRATTYAALKLEERDDFGRPQTKRREILFLKRGVIWVRDTIEVKGEGEFTAGPVWHLKTMEALKGETWFDTKERENLLLYFVPRAGHTIVEETDTRKNTPRFELRNPQLLSQQVSGRAPRGPVVFDTVLIPHAGADDARQLAAEIRVLHDEGGATLLQAGADLLFLNPTGNSVTAGALVSDASWLHLSFPSATAAAEASPGAAVTWAGKPVGVSARR
jgi:hypothetical protein